MSPYLSYHPVTLSDFTQLCVERARIATSSDGCIPSPSSNSGGRRKLVSGKNRIATRKQTPVKTAFIQKTQRQSGFAVATSPAKMPPKAEPKVILNIARPTQRPRSWRKKRSATTAGVITSLALAPKPWKIRAPSIEPKEPALADQMLDPKNKAVQTRMTGRFPTFCPTGIQRRFPIPRNSTLKLMSQLARVTLTSRSTATSTRIGLMELVM